MFQLRSQLFDEAGEGAGAGAGAGEGKPGAFDAVAFKADLMADIRKDLNGITKGLKNEITKLFAGQGAGAGAGAGESGAGEGSGEGGGEGKAKDPHTKSLERKLAALEAQVTTERTAREGETSRRRNAERDSRAQKLLGGYAFADEEAASDAFELIAPKLKWSEDGDSLLAPDGETSAEEWIKTVMGKKSHLLAPKDVSGAGARKGGSAANRRFSLEDIDNMSKFSAEDQVKLRAQVTADMASAMAGR